MATNLTMDEAVFNFLMVNGAQIVFVAPLSWGKKANGLLHSPSGKLLKLVLENDFRMTVRAEYISTLIIRPHNFAKEVEQVPRAEDMKIVEIKTVGEFGEDL